MLEDKAQIDKGERKIGMLVHASSFSGYLLPLGNIVGPLVIWLIKKDQFEFVDECGKHCINFKVTLLICYFGIAFIHLLPWYQVYFSQGDLNTMPLFSGAIIAGVILMSIDIICTLVAMKKARSGIVYKYPISFDFIK